MPNVNTRFTLSGEKEYKDAIAKIGDSMKVLNSEMRKVESEYIKNADSVDALKAKSEVFSKKIGEQKSKIEITRKALEEATKTQAAANEKFQKAKDVLDESSDEYKRLAQGVETATKKAQDWQAKLNDAEAELNKMNAKLDENNEALEKAGANGTKFQQAMERVKDSVAKAKEEGTGAKGVFANLKESFADSKGEAVGLGDAIGSAADKLGINLPEGATKALNSINGISAGSAAAVAGFATLAAAIVGVEKKLISITKESSEYAKEISKLSSVTGQSKEDVQAYTYAAEKLGITYDQINDALKETTNKMQEARDSTDDQVTVFDQLGVSIEDADGNLRNANDVFAETINALGQMQNQTERDALAMDILSENARELNPLIEAGYGELESYAQAAKNTGKVLTEDEIVALEMVGKQFNRLQQAQESTKNHLAAEFAPYLEEFLGTITSLTEGLGRAINNSQIVKAFGMLLQSIADLLPSADELAKNTIPFLTNALKPLAKMVALIADTIAVIDGILSLNGDKITTALGWNIGSGKMSYMQKIEYSGALNSGMAYRDGVGYTGTGGYMGADGKWHQNAAGSENFVGGMTWVGENGPEPVWLPQGTRIGTNQEGRSLSGGDVYNFYVQANEIREIDDFIRRMKNQRRVARMGVT